MHYLVTLTAYVATFTGCAFILLVCGILLGGAIDGLRDVIRKRRQHQQRLRTIAVDYKTTLKSIEEIARTVGYANHAQWAYPPCDKPHPPGYLPCTREKGHDGPCALHPERHCQVVEEVTEMSLKGAPIENPQVAFTITAQGWKGTPPSFSHDAVTLTGYQYTDGKTYLDPRPPVPEREVCQCRRCRKWGFIVDEFTSPHTGLCVECSKESQP